MKKRSLLLALVLLVTLAGCGRREEVPEETNPPVEEVTPPAPEEPLRLDTLRLELARGEADTDLALRAARELPELLQRYFAGAEFPVEIGKVEVSVGSTPAATAQSLVRGGVDLAFLPAETFVLCGGEAQVLLGNAPQPAIAPLGDSQNPADWNTGNKTYAAGQPWQGGTAALICAGPSAYGRQLAERAESGNPLTWAELDRARWGVLDAASDGGYRCADLYLADNYEGDRLPDLSAVTVYESYEELLRAAAAEAVDVVVLRKDARMDAAAAWTLEPGRADENGLQGFGRTLPVWQEVRCIAVTEPLYSAVAAAAPGREDLADGRFTAALLEVLERLYAEEPDLLGVFGSARFVPLEDDGLDALRRTLTIEGKTA